MTILTGLRVNSELTLGNYLGAILPTIRLSKQTRDKALIFIPDLHSIVLPVEGRVHENTLKSVRAWLAAGIDGIFYRQSQVMGHTELAWVLNCRANNKPSIPSNRI